MEITISILDRQFEFTERIDFCREKVDRECKSEYLSRLNAFHDEGIFLCPFFASYICFLDSLFIEKNLRLQIERDGLSPDLIEGSAMGFV
ncbi:MAG: hypothetical protein KC917_17755, partial [Candidatus Omnitrophica bacterium]|nr:hypothetical protein [Candidatus Omnitrophota bacterium]